MLSIRERGFRRILVNEPDHPYVGAWWAQGHIIGWEHTFTQQIRDFLLAKSAGEPPSAWFDDGLQIQRVLAAVEASARNRSVVTTTVPHCLVALADTSLGRPMGTTISC
jgi:predicted dehydrogenase